jgi:hypothetical protein
LLAPTTPLPLRVRRRVCSLCLKRFFALASTSLSRALAPAYDRLAAVPTLERIRGEAADPLIRVIARNAVFVFEGGVESPPAAAAR